MKVLSIMSMTYESQTLVSAMQTRVGQYKDLKEQLTELKKGFESIVHLDDELQGQGAEAIKGFYKAQIDVVDSWLRLINRHVAFLSGIQGDTIEANLSETVVTVPFLEEELTNATRNSKEMVTAQKNDLKKILAGIGDLIQLEPFSDDAFFENIEKAETKRTQTIDKVNEIDHKWTAEYAKSEEDQAAVMALMEQLKISSTRGGVVSPLYFNAAAYKNSEAYKNLEVRKKETAQYLKVKKEEAENRLIKDLKAQLDHVTDPDEFLKIAKQIGYENLAPTQQQYVMQLEAAKQTADIAKGIGVGLYDVGKDFVTGVWDFVTDPGETVEGVANSIMHPVQTYKYISKSISDSYERDMVNGDAYSRSHWVTYALGTVVTSVVGTKGAGAVAKTGVATTKAAAVKGATKAKELVSIPNLLPYNPKNQLSLAGGVPYNVVNGAGLKDQLISMAKVESEVSGRGRLNVEDVTKEILRTKPMNSPIPEKWYKKGGKISIDDNGTWTYINKSGISVSYPNGYPDFTPYVHPNVEPVKIEVHSPKNNPKDFENANIAAKLSKDTDPPIIDIRKPPEGYTWHHHQDGKTMMLVDEDIHREFRHIGGQSKVNGKNK
ncbi:T7SS effector LXG polymorphic toxin [Peribacillus frigoritolerans]|uniref:T7SS effector LXG polymorphic toxin n=1 Tax=Peribacillus frigoritolerans TaxID=450367 RepID=UPI00209E8983|nr:T7SS effector LXG polymorphic toxin [Peribacillus frigoritolerans]MCP1154812.1 T7SS effector LXG polymorphic toxin [Peribacillus frigoritolerans]